ncbi:hypothetical protein ACQR10_01020 [Bradyrhizobium sp. HKCCYLRH2060]|uniref:hypothetical protein n=1 Tax=Bradyrhizobium sp. HKCCYLRH2060 TaxID=3420743 RepID=UPI003EBB7A5E
MNDWAEPVRRAAARYVQRVQRQIVPEVAASSAPYLLDRRHSWGRWSREADLLDDVFGRPDVLLNDWAEPVRRAAARYVQRVQRQIVPEVAASSAPYLLDRRHSWGRWSREADLLDDVFGRPDVLLNDWAEPVRRAAARYVQRVQRQIVPEVAASSAPYLLDRRHSWGRWSREADLLDDVFGRPDVLLNDWAEPVRRAAARYVQRVQRQIVPEVAASSAPYLLDRRHSWGRWSREADLLDDVFGRPDVLLNDWAEPVRRAAARYVQRVQRQIVPEVAASSAPYLLDRRHSWGRWSREADLLDDVFGRPDVLLNDWAEPVRRAAARYVQRVQRQIVPEVAASSAPYLLDRRHSWGRWSREADLLDDVFGRPDVLLNDWAEPVRRAAARYVQRVQRQIVPEVAASSAPYLLDRRHSWGRWSREADLLDDVFGRPDVLLNDWAEPVRRAAARYVQRVQRQIVPEVAASSAPYLLDRRHSWGRWSREADLLDDVFGRPDVLLNDWAEPVRRAAARYVQRVQRQIVPEVAASSAPYLLDRRHSWGRWSREADLLDDVFGRPDVLPIIAGFLQRTANGSLAKYLRLLARNPAIDQYLPALAASAIQPQVRAIAYHSLLTGNVTWFAGYEWQWIDKVYGIRKRVPKLDHRPLQDIALPPDLFWQAARDASVIVRRAAADALIASRAAVPDEDRLIAHFEQDKNPSVRSRADFLRRRPRLS